MFGSFTGSNSNPTSDWGEDLINSVASNTLRHLFTRSDSVEVKVRCQPPSKLLQGSIDSFKMQGRGIVIRRDFRTEEISFETDAVALDFASVLQGKISLRQPTQAIALIKLTESDINTAFSAQLVRQRLENLTDERLTNLSGGEPVSFTAIKLQLLPANRVKLQALANFPNRAIPISFSCALGLAKRRRITYDDPEFIAADIPADCHDLAKILMGILVDIFNEMVDLDRFDLDGVTLRLNRLETEGETLNFSGYAQIERIPRTG
ncbi:DUF2993 domain-containing protein [Spirulina sp. CCNP1310]|uniref:LmeA family phospholipid-binding protein n=1 Tax=Spirulina sp. CCNP1310 TaxID=3110249 RepID=UPI002B1FB430|nr:DUF2993 domain-containing protein [Spirulina sp. CCNP1310]MEA5420069.1 DUF2993 domain-containing protein [Spirulina sp. CCNP1310]